MAGSRTVLALLLAAGCGADHAAPALDSAPADAVPNALLAPFAQDRAGIYQMAADADYLYWVENGQFDHTADVRRVPLGGGAIETLFSTSERMYSLAVADGDVYAVRTGPPGNAVYRIAASDHHVDTLATPENPLAVAVDGGWVYYSEGVSPDGRILRVPTGGGTPEVVVADVDAPGDLVPAGGTLYYAEMNRGRVMSVVPGEAPVVLASGWVGTWRVALDATYVYFSGCVNGECEVDRLYRVPRAGGATETIFVGGPWPELGLSVSGDAIQWGVHTFAVAGGEHALPLPPDVVPIAVAATPDAFYCGDFATGAIYRVPR